MLGATPQRPPVDQELVGRTREVAIVEGFLDSTERLPGAVRLIGEAGIGKSTIWDLATEYAEARGYRCLKARPAQSERALAFATLGDLLGDVYPDVADRLSEPQRRALAAALLLVDAPVAPEHRTLGIATLSTLRLLAQEQPVLVAVDDEQWLDRASHSVLGFCLRRITDERVALLLASRPPDGSTHEAASLDTRLPTEEIEVTGLSLGALHAIVVERIGTVLPRPQLRRLHELSRGNPFLALELVRASNAGRLRLDTVEKGGADLDRLVGARLDALPKPTRLALYAAAATAHPSIQLLDALFDSQGQLLIQPAEAVGIVEANGEEVTFTHPLLASSAYAAVSADEGRRTHGLLAGLVDDPVERARHLALAATARDENVAAEAERAALAVFSRGAPHAAAELLDMAVRMTPGENADERRRRTALQAEYLFESGDTAGAAALLEPLIESMPRGPERAPLLALLARIRHFGDDVESGTALNAQALAEAGHDHRLAASLHEGLAWGLFLMRDDLAEAARQARAAVRAARKATDDIALGEAYAVEAVTSLAIGAASRGAIDRAMELEPAFVHVRVLRHPSYAKGYVALCADRLDDARAIFEDLLTRAEEHGDESALPSILVQLSMAEILAGDWDTADEHARVGYAFAEQSGQRPSRAALRGRQALLSVLRGRLDEGDALAREALGLAGAKVDDPASMLRAFARGGEMGAWALGAAALAQGRAAYAASSLLPLSQKLLDAGVREPGELRFLPDTVETLVALGRIDEADVITSSMEQMALRARRSTAAGIAARSRAQVLAARGDVATALESANTAVQALSSGSLPLELARSQLLLGGLERRMRMKRAARETLAAAIGTFAVLGADGFRDRAEAETGRIGGRSQSEGGLTPTESRVVELVVKGLSNKEVATALAISSKTVELHLSHVYAKLDVSSRTELVRYVSGLRSS
jgi:DNA-binding NarL/FixJ family response regulator/tetratricopeptide (TPR) repeat protein